MKNRQRNRIISSIMAVVILFVTVSVTYFGVGNVTVSAAENSITNPQHNRYVSYLEKAEELKTPLAIYNYIRNNINYEYYSDLRKGAEATYDSMGGNDVDQAVLLKEMLEHNGYEARYVTGKIKITPKLAGQITGCEDLETAAKILALSDRTPVVVRNNGNPLYIEIDHTWVEAYVPYTDYRGAGNNSGEYVWIPLDTTIKKYESNDNIYEHWGEWGETADSAEAFIAENSDLYITRRQIVREDMEYLPLSLQYEVLEEYEIRSEWDENRYDTISFIFENGESVVYKSCELYGKTIIIEYEKLENNMVRAGLKVDGCVAAYSKAVEEGEKEKFTMVVKSGSHSNRIENDLKAGGMFCVTLDTQNITERELQLVEERFTGIASSVTEKNVYSADYLGVLLDYAGRMYFAQLDVNDRMIAEQRNIVETRSLSVGMTGFNYDSANDSGELFIDVDLDFHMAAALSGNQKEVVSYMMAIGMISSLYENVIWEEITGEPSVSTISLMKEALDSDVDIIMVNKNNWSQVKQTIQVDDDVVIELENAVNQGKTVVVPNGMLDIGDWHGAGYIVTDTETGAGQYMMYGNLQTLNGGSGPFAVNLAYLVGLIINSFDIAESLLLINHILAAFAAGSVVGGMILYVLMVGVFIFSVSEYEKNFNLMLEYINGNGEAGDEIVGRTVFDVAFRLAFKGVSHMISSQTQRLATKLLSKYVDEGTAAVIAGNSDELYDTVRYIRKLEKSGVSSSIISKSLETLGAGELGKLVKIAAGGFGDDVLEKILLNKGVLNTVSAGSIIRVLKGTANNADDVLKLFSRYGEHVNDFFLLYGDDVLGFMIAHGDDGYRIISTYGHDAMIVVNELKDAAFEAFDKYGHDALKYLGGSKTRLLP